MATRRTPTGGASSRRTSRQGRRVVAFSLSGHGALRLARRLLDGPVRARGDRRRECERPVRRAAAADPGRTFVRQLRGAHRRAHARHAARRSRAGRRRAGRISDERRRIRRRARARPSAPRVPDARTGDGAISLRAGTVLRQPVHRGFPRAHVARSHAGRARAARAGRGDSIPTCARRSGALADAELLAAAGVPHGAAVRRPFEAA